MLIMARAPTLTRRPISMAYIGNAVNASNQSTYTFAGQSIGTPSVDRVVVVCVATNVSGSISNVTVGGITASIAASAANVLEKAQIRYRKVASGATADIVVTLTGTGNHCGIAVYTYTGGYNVPVVTDNLTSMSNSFTDTMTVSTGGVLIGMSQTSGSGSNRFAFTGVTEDFEAAHGSSGEDFGAGHLEYANASTPTVGVVVSSPSSPTSAFASFA